MGSARPSEQPRFRFFSYSGADPWEWMPSHWVRPGVVFVGADKQFYELVKVGDLGWDCEEVEERRVGGLEQVRAVFAKREEYARARSRLAEARARGEDSVENRQAVRERKEEVERLGDELIRLCNSKEVKARERGVDWDRVKIRALPVLFVGLVLAVASCIVRLYRIVPDEAGRMVLNAAFVLGVAVATGAGLWMAYRYRERLPLAQATGCLGLVGIVVLALVALFLFFVFFGAFGTR